MVRVRELSEPYRAIKQWKLEENFEGSFWFCYTYFEGRGVTKIHYPYRHVPVHCPNNTSTPCAYCKGFFIFIFFYFFSESAPHFRCYQCGVFLHRSRDKLCWIHFLGNR
jgi:hypothetical protein